MTCLRIHTPGLSSMSKVVRQFCHCVARKVAVDGAFWRMISAASVQATDPKAFFTSTVRIGQSGLQLMAAWTSAASRGAPPGRLYPNCR